MILWEGFVESERLVNGLQALLWCDCYALKHHHYIDSAQSFTDWINVLCALYMLVEEQPRVLRATVEREIRWHFACYDDGKNRYN